MDPRTDPVVQALLTLIQLALKAERARRQRLASATLREVKERAA
ncbi:MAG: hypothetical protein WED12_07500 [Chloroflexota bacterium]